LKLFFPGWAWQKSLAAKLKFFIPRSIKNKTKNPQRFARG
jgi:hypothetical protein